MPPGMPSPDWSQWGIAGALIGCIVFLFAWTLIKSSPATTAQFREDMRAARADFTKALADQQSGLLATLREQRADFTAVLKEQRAEFTAAIKDITRESEDAITRAVEKALGKRP